jgi:hypothetical protein
MQTPEDYDTGFICKACGKWFADKDTKHWDTKWTEPDADGEPHLLELINECPLCGEVRSYVPNECVFRGIQTRISS